MQSQIPSPLVRTALLTAAVTVGVAVLTSDSASAQEELRVWKGEQSSNWNDDLNWSPNSAPRAANRIAVFNVTPENPPVVETSVTVVGGVWMTGDEVGDITITSNPASNPTFQTNGITMDGMDNVGILIDNTSTGSLTINTASFKIDGNDQYWVNNSSNLFTLAAPTNLNGKSVTISGSGDTLISGIVNNSKGSSTLTKSGSGTLITTGALSYSGATTVNAGTFLLNGSLSNSDSHQVIVNGGTLGGTGTIGRATTIHEDGTLAPGVSSDAAGMLTINRNLTLNGTAAFDLIDAENHDVLLFNATNEGNRTLTFGGTLVVEADPGVTFAAGQVFDLFDWGNSTTVSGRFEDIQLPALSGGLSWQMFGDQPFNYETGEIVVVPEPAAFTLLLPAVALLPRRRRQIRA